MTVYKAQSTQHRSEKTGVARLSGFDGPMAGRFSRAAGGPARGRLGLLMKA